MITSILDARLTTLYDRAYADTGAYRSVPTDIRERVDVLLAERNNCPEPRVYDIDAEIIRMLSPYVEV